MSRAENKYGARATEVDGIRFDSRKEARRYSELLLMEHAGVITDLQLQVRYPLHARVPVGVDPVKVADYVCDFSYALANGYAVVEDCKGVRTPMYRLKKKWMAAEYGIEILET